MPLTPCFFTNTGSIPVGATKLKAKEHKSSKMKLWRFRLVARTHASHAWNTGSIPVGATKKQVRVKMVARIHASHTLFFYEHWFDSRRRYKLKAKEHKISRHLEIMALSSSG